MFTNFENMQAQPEDGISFFFLSRNITLKKRKGLKHFLVSIIRREGKKLGYINYIFCTDEHLLSINRQYLHHNYYTDIITFDLSDDPEIIEAEIYISADRIRDNASQFRTTIENETYRVMFHGILHLCGYGDKTFKEKQEMREKENIYLLKYKAQ